MAELIHIPDRAGVENVIEPLSGSNWNPHPGTMRHAVGKPKPHVGLTPKDPKKVPANCWHQPLGLWVNEPQIIPEKPPPVAPAEWCGVTKSVAVSVSSLQMQINKQNRYCHYFKLVSVLLVC